MAVVRNVLLLDPAAEQKQTTDSALADTGWQRFFLYTREEPKDAEVPLAYAPSTLDALNELVAEPNGMAPLWGGSFQYVEGAEGVDPRKVVEPGADRVVAVTSDDGRHHAIAACPDGSERLLMQEAWESLGVMEARMVADWWRALDRRYPPRGEKP